MKYRFPALALIAIANMLWAQNSTSPETLNPQTLAPETLTLGAAISATLAHNPQLAGYQFRTKALEAERETAALKPAWRISTELENIAGTGDYSGVDGAELTLALSSVIEPKIQRDARMDVATARQQQWLSEQRVATLDVLTAVTRNYISLAAGQEQLVLHQQDLQLAKATVSSLQRQVDSGRTPEADLLRAEAAMAQAEIEVLHAHHRLKSQRIKLSLFWADTTPGFSRVSADLYALPPAGDLEKMLEQLEKNPDLLLLSRNVDLRAAELRKAQNAGKAELEWNAGIRRLEATDDAALVLGMSMPLGSAKRAHSLVASAQAEQQGAEHQRNITRTGFQARLASLHEIYGETLLEAGFLKNEVIVKLEKALRATQAAFERGRYGYPELRLAQADLLKARGQLIELATQAHLLRIDIERLTGVALPAAPVSSPDGQSASFTTPSTYSELK